MVPVSKQRIENPRDVQRLRLRLEGADLSSPDLQGAGQRVDGDVIEILDARGLVAARSYRGPRGIPATGAFHRKRRPRNPGRGRARARGHHRRARARRAADATRERAARKETDRQPAIRASRSCGRASATATSTPRCSWLWRARSGIPARISVGLVSVRSAFYYHAWPEVYVDEGKGRGLWLPVDPTLNQFPADATHLRLASGGLDKQVAILPLIGTREDDDPGSRSRAGRIHGDRRPAAGGHDAAHHCRCPSVSRAAAGRWARVRTVTMIAVTGLVKRYGTFTAVDGVSLEVAAGRRFTVSSDRTAPARPPPSA